MLDFGFYNMDCMDGMKEFPDQFFDLAIVDPPYGINVGQAAMGAGAASLLTETDQPRTCAPGGGNKTYIPFGGKKKTDKTQPELWGGVPSDRRREAVRKQSKSEGVCYRPQNLQGVR